MSCLGPAIPTCLWNMLKDRDVDLADNGERRQATHGREGG